MKSQQTRRRYIAIIIYSKKQQTKQETFQSIKKSMATLYEEHIFYQADLRILEYNQQDNQAILRCNHITLPQLRESIAKVKEIAGTPTTIRIIGVSGTIKRLRRKFLNNP
ncbi:MAG TPA: Rpp14/Pop5 family protein [archaeon]|nr:Rpp14/Pop5 family protein [archaeon]